MKFVLIIAALIAAGLVYLLLNTARAPTNLGVSDGRLAPLPGTPNAVSSQARDPQYRVSPFPFRDDLQTTMSSLTDTLDAHGGMTIVQKDSNYLHAVHTTPLLRFKDDLEFYLDEQNRVVHFRSASRVGSSDLGLNRDRYNRLMTLYTADRPAPADET